MTHRLNFLVILTALLALVGFMSVFTVDQREYAIKLEFSDIVRSDFPPGLHFKIPFVNRIAKYPNRIMTYENPDERFLTGEKKNLIVDYFVTWRIVNPDQYYRSVGGDESRAIDRLSAIVKEGIKAAISQRTVQEVVSAERSELMDEMLVEAQRHSPELGIEVVDVRVKRIDLADEVSDSVYERMREERRRTAAQLRAEGEEEWLRTQADADRQRTVILAEAYRDAERLRGDGEGRAAEIYARAHSQNLEFFKFYRSMAAYREAIGRDQDVLVLQPDSDFFRYLQSRLGTEPVPN